MQFITRLNKIQTRIIIVNTYSNNKKKYCNLDTTFGYKLKEVKKSIYYFMEKLKKKFFLE